MITYPRLKPGATIGVTAPSSGLSPDLHFLLKQASERMTQEGFEVRIGETPWLQNKAKSSPATVRAHEFTEMLRDDAVGLVFPPWGGELLIEIVEHLDFGAIPPKWVLGYSDVSVLLLAITLRTGIATAHGTNLIDLRGEYSDETTAAWRTALSTPAGGSFEQRSSPFYQKEWNHDHPSPCIFHLNEPTEWKTVSGEDAAFQGRLLGGCVDVIRHLIGTPYGDAAKFRREHVGGDPLVWYLENCELNAADLRRSLVQMRLAGWFDGCSGILFGRSGANRPMGDYAEIDVYEDLARELGVPIVYDIDCGHVPPQVTFVNGAYAEIEVTEGKGTVKQTYLP
ncbi:S66 peptidase family protein [Cohnella suwonensis]|uniref:S66 peptidase family protein n=1 Tax=Cohnella suwonensis TaxID=696072 RepID=A0ABW0LVF6_9BACL